MKIEDIKNTIICGDALVELKKLPGESVDMVLTSPPYYGLRNYGDYKEQIGLEKTFEEFLKKILEITDEIKRVLKPSGQFWLNFGDCYGGLMQGYGAKRKSKSGIQAPAGIDKRYADKNLPTIWQIGSEPHNFQKETGVDTDHFASFPQALCEIPIKFGCPKDGIVCDPFCGSGTALVVAKKLGRNFIGIELNKKYIEIAEKRLAAVPKTLFQ